MKHPFDRIITHYLLSTAIEQEKMKRIQISTKHIMVRERPRNLHEDPAPFSQATSKAILESEDFRRFALRNFDHRMGIYLDEAPEKDYEVAVFADRGSFYRGAEFDVALWNEFKKLRELVNWDIGLPEDLNFGSHKYIDGICIFDTELGDTADFRYDLHFFVTHQNWGDQKTIDVIENDFQRWSREIAAESEQEKISNFPVCLKSEDPANGTVCSR